MTHLTGTLRLPACIHVGYGARHQIPTALALHGRRVLAVIDPFLVETPLVRAALESLRADFELLVYRDILPELPVDSLAEAGEVARAFAPDAILAIGGGSALDAAKLIGLLAVHGGPLSRYYGENAVPGPTLPLIAVPTTAGTGSEVTPVAVVSDPARELKVGISSPHLIPSAALVDPEFTLAAPASVTAFSGIDALVHAVESFTAAPGSPDWAGTLPVFTGRNAFSDLIALDAVEKLGRWLPTVVSQPGDRHAREQVAWGSLLGGMSFGPTGTHLSHALQYPIGALTKTPHGLGTGLMLPFVLDTLRREATLTARIAAIGVALGSTATTPDGQADEAITLLRVLNESIGVPPTLADLGVTADDLPRIAELALGATRLIAIAPTAVTGDLLLSILTHAHRGTLTERSTS